MRTCKYYKHCKNGDTSEIKTATGEKHGDFFLEKRLNRWGATDKTSGALVAWGRTKKELKERLDSPEFAMIFGEFKQTQTYKDTVKEFKKAIEESEEMFGRVEV